jgi:glycosyltransferase involved in cell wall biosynthesis
MWYQQSADAIFYPGLKWMDEFGLRLRAATGRKIPLISTMEGLVGSAQRQARFSSWAEHPVFCQEVDESTLRRIDTIYEISDHIIAISPFIAKLGRQLYGDKFSTHPLGIESSIFRPIANEKPLRPRVVNAASFQTRKRPELFLELAKRFPHADFVWYGDGNIRMRFVEEALRSNLTNLSFPGAKPPDELANAFQSATCFAMPSNSEGVPKVTQEAAACSLPIVIFGYYEAPTVINNLNGFVVWNDFEFFNRVEKLINDRALAMKMGQHSAALSENWNWDKVAPEWEKQIADCLPA